MFTGLLLQELGRFTYKNVIGQCGLKRAAPARAASQSCYHHWVDCEVIADVLVKKVVF